MVSDLQHEQPAAPVPSKEYVSKTTLRENIGCHAKFRNSDANGPWSKERIPLMLPPEFPCESTARSHGDRGSLSLFYPPSTPSVQLSVEHTVGAR